MFPSRGHPFPRPSAPGGLRAEWQVRRGLGSRTFQRGAGSGSCSAPSSALMKLRVGTPRRRGAHLKNANAIGKSGANWNNFLLAAK